MKEEAGVKKLLSYLPSLRSLQEGVIMMAFGIMLMNGGGFAIRVTSESEPV